MPRKSSIKFMISYVQDYLDGETERMFFDMDFNHYLIEHYPRMEQENPDQAECFAYYLSEEGIDRCDGLSNSEHKKLIQRQFDEFQAAMRDGLY